MLVVYHHLMAEEATVLVLNLLVQEHRPHIFGLNGQRRLSSMNLLQTPNSKGMMTLTVGIQRTTILQRSGLCGDGSLNTSISSTITMKNSDLRQLVLIA